MKKLFSICLSLMLVLMALAGCGKQDDGVVNIAIVQQLDHASMDEIRMAIQAELDVQSEALGIEIRYQAFNGQNDGTVLSQIGAKILGGSYDVVIPIGTLAAQQMVVAMDGRIPVVYAAVSDPEHAGLTGFDNVTGTSDALNTQFMLDMMLAVQPEAKTVGLLYSSSEPNSATPIAQAKAYLDSKGITYIEKTGTTADEVLAAANSLAGRVDAVFTPTDNAIMACEGAVADVLTKAGVPHYAGADSFVTAGAFATCGVSYRDLGTKTAQMAVELVTRDQVPEFHVMAGGIITVNTETAAALNLDHAPFAQMAGTVIEVTTG